MPRYSSETLKGIEGFTSEKEWTIYATGWYKLLMQANNAISGVAVGIQINGIGVNYMRTSGQLYEGFSVIAYLRVNDKVKWTASNASFAGVAGLYSIT